MSTKKSILPSFNYNFKCVLDEIGRRFYKQILITGKGIFFILLPDSRFDPETCFWNMKISNLKFIKILKSEKYYYQFKIFFNFCFIISKTTAIWLKSSKMLNFCKSLTSQNRKVNKMRPYNQAQSPWTVYY